MSTLKVNKIRDTAGSADSITLDPNGGAVIAGVTTVSTVKVGSGVTITSDGDIFHSGVCTATSFSGQIPAASIVGVCTSGLSKTGGFGKFSSYALLAKVHDSGTSTTYFGAYTTGAWRTRDIDTEVSDEDGIVTISSNQFTLQAGSYLINAFAPACQVSCHQTRIYNVTDTTVVQLGSVEFAYSASASGNPSYVSARVTITGAKVFEIQHRCATSRADYGFGVGTSGGYNTNTTGTRIGGGGAGYNTGSSIPSNSAANGQANTGGGGGSGGNGGSGVVLIKF